MSTRVRILGRTGALMLLAACAACSDHDGGPGYYDYGYPCRDDYDCSPGSFCVDKDKGSCLPACRADQDCGPGYACRNQKRHGAPGDAAVCVRD